LFPWKVIFTFL